MRRSIALLEARRQRLGEDAACDEDLAATLSLRLLSLPSVRSDVVAAVRARLAAGAGPSSGEVAWQILVGAPAGSPD
jgi:hypothetical protein